MLFRFLVGIWCFRVFYYILADFVYFNEFGWFWCVLLYLCNFAYILLVVDFLRFWFCGVFDDLAGFRFWVLSVGLMVYCFTCFCVVCIFIVLEFGFECGLLDVVYFGVCC